MKTLIEMKCPSCGAALEVDKDREFFFCQFCGTKLMSNDENQFTIRHIDEAEIKRAETERIIKLREIEISEKKKADQLADIELAEKKKKKQKLSVIIWTVTAIVLFLIGLIVEIKGPAKSNTGVYILLLSFCIGFLAVSCSKTKDKRKSLSPNSIIITNAISTGRGKNYEVLSGLMRGAGFSNITCVPLKDLSPSNSKKSGRVESFSIDEYEDNEISAGDLFSPDATIIITYHSL